MGQPKPLLPFGDRTAIDLLLSTLVEAEIADIVLVLGPNGDAVAEIAGRYPVRIVWNRADGSDMADSLRIGTGHLAPETRGVLIALADHPLVAAQTLRRLAERHGEAPASILIPTFDTQKGHPILVPRPVLSELDTCATLRDVVRRDPSRVCLVPVADAGILLDLDTPEDYRQGLRHHAGMEV